tara:strand:- start:214 stop:462 length:249 start_codon:yes stop_codon:yes gene_type:complete
MIWIVASVKGGKKGSSQTIDASSLFLFSTEHLQHAPVLTDDKAARCPKYETIASSKGQWHDKESIETFLGQYQQLCTYHKTR